MDQAGRIRELEQRLSLLEAKERISSEADSLVEKAIRDHLPLVRALDLLLPMLTSHTGCRSVLLNTFDESLERRSFFHGAEVEVPHDTVIERTEREGRGFWSDDRGTVLAQRLDVAGESFGTLALGYGGALGPMAREVGFALMNAFAEQLDNYLASIARARQKVSITNALSEALRHPVLDEGISQAIEVLRRYVGFVDLLLVFRHDEERFGRGVLHYKIIESGALTHDSHAPGDIEVDDFIRDHAPRLIREGARDLVERFGIAKAREELVIRGISEGKILGRLVLTTKAGELTTFDRDLVERFVDFLERRIVDFNKDWKRLSLSFADDAVQRLLRESDYHARFLTPREHDVAVMFCDISGFTRLSEQVLREPTRIGELIDVWGKRVVDIIWETGGVFDKMVGDCVIGLWGPPFYDLTPRKACLAATSAARRIRDYTRSIGQDLPILSSLGASIGVATGLSYCPLYVGVFGPNDDYTGFSSGMNNAARLQSIAECDEILCMETFVAACGQDEAFGEERSSKAKNVGAPLRYRPLR